MALKVKAVERLLKFDKESAGQHRHPDHLHRPQRQRGEARDQYLWRGGRP